MPAPLAVALSGGVDSSALLAAAVETGRKPIAYSFTLDGRGSSDFVRASRTAATLGVPFRPVWLPTDVETLRNDVRTLVTGYGLTRKPDVECLWALRRLYRAVDEPGVVSGLAADGYFALSRKAVIEWRSNPEPLDGWIDSYFRGPILGQRDALEAIAADENLVTDAPYIDVRLSGAMRGLRWRDVNVPRQKRPIWDAFPTLRRYRWIIRRHQNLQLADSGIASLFESLLATDWNVGGWRTPGPIYRALADGRIR